MLGRLLLVTSFAALCMLVVEARAIDDGRPYHSDVSVVWWTPLEPGMIPDPDTGVVTSDGMLLTVTDSGHPMAIDLSSGMQRWISTASAERGIAPVECGSGAAFAGSEGTMVYVHIDGSVGWTMEFPKTCERLASDGSRIFASSGSTLWAVDPVGGSILWEVELDAAVSSLQAVRDHCVVSCDNSKLIGLDPSAGAIRWEIRADTDIGDRLVLDATAAYAVSKHGVAMSVRLDDGRVLWRRSLVSTEQPHPLFVDGAPVFRHGDLLFITGNGFYGLRILSCSTGDLLAAESIPAAPFRHGFGAVGAVAVLSVPYSGAGVVVIDLHRHSVVKRVALPHDPELLATWRGQLVFSKDDAIFAVRPLPTLRSANVDREAVVVAIPGTLWRAGTVVALVVASALIAFCSGRSLAPTALVRVQFWFTTCSAVLVCCVCIWAAAVFLRVALRPINTLESLLFAIALLGPPTALIWSFFRSLLQVRPPTFNEQLCCARTVPGLIPLIQSLRREMGIRQPLAVIARGMEGPVVTCRGIARPLLIVPSDLSSVVLRAAGGDTSTAQSLLRFVLAHELAHVLHRDLWVLSLSRAFHVSRHHTGLAVVSVGTILALFIGARVLNPTGAVATLGPPIASLLCVATLVLAACTRVLLRERERLADAVATLRISSQQLSSLTTASGGTDKLAPLAQFAVSVRVHGPSVPSYLGFGVPPAARGRHPLRGLYQRLAETTARRYVFPGSMGGDTAFVANVLWASSLGVVVFLAMHVTWSYGFGHVLVSRAQVGDGALSSGYLEAMEGFSRFAGRRGSSVNILWFIGTAACGFLMAVLVSLPRAAAVRGEPMPRQGQALYVGAQAVLCGVLFLFAVGLFQDWLHLRVGPLFSALRVSPGAVVAWLFLAAAAHCAFAATGGIINQRAAWNLAGETAIILLALAASALTSYVLLHSLEPIERIPWVFVICSVTFWLTMGTPVRRLVGFQYIGAERAWVAWTVGTKLARPTMMAEASRGKGRGAFMAVGTASLVALIVPSALMSNAVGPWLLRQNAAFYDGSRRALTEPESMSHLAMRIDMRSGGVSPAILGGVALTSLVLVLCLAGLLTSAFSRAGRIHRTISQTAALARIQLMVERQLISSESASRVKRQVMEVARRRRLSLQPPYHTLWCRFACDAYVCGTACGLTPNCSEMAVFREFVRSCAPQNGGYGGLPGATADLWHSAHAIDTFGTDRQGPALHTFLTDQIDALLRCHTTMPPTEWLEQVSLSVRALVDLAGAPILSLGQRGSVVRATIDVWSRSGARIADTAAALEVVAELAPSADEERRRIIEQHLPVLDSWLVTASPAGAEAALRVLRAVRACVPEGFRSRSSVVQFADHIAIAGAREESSRLVPVPEPVRPKSEGRQ